LQSEARKSKVSRMRPAPVLRLAAAVASLALAHAACDKKGTVDQCNAFIERANISQAVLKLVTLEGDAAQLEEDAKKVDNEVQWVKGVALTDPKLTKLRDDYAANLQKLAATIRDLAKLQSMDVKNAEDVKKIADAVDDVEKEQSQLVIDINDYCGGR